MKDHFKGKDALHHIVEVQAEGKLTSAEIHGAETPGFLFAATDAAKEMSVMIALIALLLGYFEFLPEQQLFVLLSFVSGAFFWKIGRASWLSWSRLERLHRVMAEERREIEQNRAQEKEELKALYNAKGFEGKLLDEVVDVLMADGDRALRVMLEEELGFRLEENEHPIVQGLGAGFGVLVSGLLLLGAFMWAGKALFLGLAVLIIGASSLVTARLEHNKVIPAVMWNIAIALFAYLVAFYCIELL